MEAPIATQYAAHQLHESNIFQPPHPGLVPQSDIGLDNFQFDPQLENQPDLSLQARHSFDGTPFDSRADQQARFQEIRPNSNAAISHNGSVSHGSPYTLHPRTGRQRPEDGNPGGHLFGVLTPQHQLHSQPQSHVGALSRFQNEIDLRPQPPVESGSSGGHFSNMKLIPNPPNLEEWRQRLFDVDDTIAMTEDEYVSLMEGNIMGRLSKLISQVPNILSARGQHLLPSLDSEV